MNTGPRTTLNSRTAKYIVIRLTLNDEFDVMRDGTDCVAERARVETAVGRAESEQAHSSPDDRHVIAGSQFAPVLVPRERRRGRGGRLAEHGHRVALFLDQQARRRFAKHRRSCITHTQRIVNDYDSITQRKVFVRLIGLHEAH